MLRRFCLFLLMACLVLPAMAAPLHCAPAPVEASAHHGHDGHQQKRQAPAQQAQHDCIGCIAPFAAARGAAQPELLAPSREKPHNQLLLARLTSGPDTPPPRA